MVFICNSAFVSDTDYEEEYFIPYFNNENSAFMLSDFQKWAIKAIIEGDHVLITAHTGSGKTLPAEFAMRYMVEQGKKVIYTTPIKALSNQKLFDFRRKFPHISFGILTGDCKDNPEADVLIMTTEILRNTLFQKQQILKDDKEKNAALLFEMDFENELGAVIFDEVHYINDAERGSVWEQSILLLPPQVQMVMLSATIDKPEMFAGWIETEKNKQLLKLNILKSEEERLKLKKVYLASTYERVVPLTHYMWLSLPSTIFQLARKIPQYEDKLINISKKPLLITDAKGQFNEPNYYKVKEALDFMHVKSPHTFVKRQFVLDDLIRYLNKNEMLPAICFIFSRKQVEVAAQEVGMCLFEPDSGIPAIIERECRHVIANKLVNYKEYIELPEYLELVGLLQKGIAIHHAGMLPVLREMVELLFEKGFIKLLFATETFAVGINMPTKTVIFSGLTKFNGSTMRLLFPHEYTQMAGRAGRRGIDTIGHVIHCSNLFELPSCTEYKTILTGKPQTLISKFKISYNLVLNMLSHNSLANENQNMNTTYDGIMQFVDKSLLAFDIKNELEAYDKKDKDLKDILEKKRELLKLCQTPEQAMQEYKEKTILLNTLTNSARKKVRKELNDIETLYKFLLTDYKKFEACAVAEGEIKQNNLFRQHSSDYIQTVIEQVMKNVLFDHGFILFCQNESDKNKITEKGLIASQLHEMHPLIFADIYTSTAGFVNLSAEELAALFSCFSNVNVAEDMKQLFPNAHSYELNKTSMEFYKALEKYECLEKRLMIDSGSSYDMNFDIQNDILEWCDAPNEEECKRIIHSIKKMKNISLGDFVKAILKINTIAGEIEKVCDITNNIKLLEKVKRIPELTLKYVVTNQSLYL